MTDGTGTSTWEWDSLGRLTRSVDGAGKTVAYGYDRRGNATSIVYPGQTDPVSWAFDDAGRLWKVKDWLNHETVFNYDANSFITSEVYPNGTKATKTPDAAGRLISISHAPTATPASPFVSFTYGRDDVNQVQSVTSTGVPADNHTYGYSPLNQLSSDNASLYSYDNADNLAAFPSGATLTHDATNQLSSLTNTAGTTTFGYDTRGNRTTITPPTGPATTLTYDQANRLTAHSTANASYTYNGDGVRTTKTVAGATTGVTWDVAQGLPLLLVDGTTNYVYGPGGLPIEQINSGGQVTYYHHDQLGSTRALTNGSGTVVATYTYDPYGKLSGSTGTATNPFRYAGQYTDTETGLVYMRARYYDPATGSFLTRDPIEGQTQEPYGYVGGNPLNATDPLGLCWGPGCWAEDAWDATGGRAVTFVDEHRHTAVNLATGFVAGTAFVACGVSVVCGVGVGAGAIVLGGVSHLGVDSISSDTEHDFGVYQAFGHSTVSTATSALCVYTLGATCFKTLLGGGAAAAGASLYGGFGFLEKRLVDLGQGTLNALLEEPC